MRRKKNNNNKHNRTIDVVGMGSDEKSESFYKKPHKNKKIKMF